MNHKPTCTDAKQSEPRVDSFRGAELPSALKAAIDNYTHVEFGHVPIVQKYKWAKPSWSVVVRVGDELVSFLNIVERDAKIDGKLTKIAGINNVITPPSFRNKGYSTLAMERAAKLIFDPINADLGLLLCANELVLFYERLGWQIASGPLVFDQPGEKVTWTQNVMVYLCTTEPFTGGKIDLCGFPW